MVAFQYADLAVAWCMEVQKNLLFADWPKDILDHPSCAAVPLPEGMITDVPYLIRGLRVRMGVHSGFPEVQYNARTNSVDYFGPMV